MLVGYGMSGGDGGAVCVQDTAMRRVYMRVRVGVGLEAREQGRWLYIERLHTSRVPHESSVGTIRKTESESTDSLRSM